MSVRKKKDKKVKEEAIVRIEGITKRYGKVVAVDDMSLHIPKNSVFGLLGPNGAGKTTTLGICCGLIRPDRGDVTIAGHSITDETEEAKQCLGLLAERSSFYPDRTAFDHLVLFGKLSSVKDPKAKAEKVLKMVGLEERMHHKVKTFSHGMDKLLDLAQAFLADPEVVFLDEPISGLDPKVAYKIKEIIKQQGKRRTIVLSSHYLEAVDKLCSHIAIMKDGKIRKQGRIKDVKKGNSLEKVFLDLL